MKRILFSLIFCLFLPFSLAAKELPEYPCYQLIEEPVLDGKIEEKAWSNIPRATGFFILLGKGGCALEKQTYFKAGWNEKAIYVAVRSEEPEPEKMTAELKDEGMICREDSMEIFFFPQKADNYFQFMVNTIGSRWNGIDYGNPQPIWNWQARAYVGKDFWSLEARIPFEVLKRVPEKGEKWRVNIARNTLTGPDSERYTCWPPLEGGFHDIENFGSFVFKGKPPSLEKVRHIEKELSASCHNGLKVRLSKIAESFSEYRESIEKGIKNPDFQKEAVSLKEIWESIETVSKKKEISTKELRSALKKVENTNLPERSKVFKKKSEVLKNKALLEGLFD